MDLKKAQELINQYKPLRDNSAGISINFPQAQIPLEIATLGTMTIRLDSLKRFHLKRDLGLEVKGTYEVIAKWDLSL